MMTFRHSEMLKDQVNAARGAEDGKRAENRLRNTGRIIW
jgi:hypothetical protein